MKRRSRFARQLAWAGRRHGIAALLSLTLAAPAAAQVTFTDPNPATKPDSRRSAAFAVEPTASGDRLWLWGGFNGSAVQAMARYDTWNNTWTTGLAGANEPIARERMASAWHAGSQRLVVFGGMSSSGFSFAFNDTLYLYDPASNAWTAPAISGTPPNARADVMLFYAPHVDALFLFGGVGGSAPSGSEWYADAYRLDIANDGQSATWTKLTTSGTAPSGRGAYCGAYDEARRRIIVFGGHYGLQGGAFNAKYLMAGDTFQLDVQSNAWTQDTHSGDVPAARGFTQCSFDASQDRLFLYGGQLHLDNNPTGGTFTYDPVAKVWSTHTPASTPGSLSDASTLFSPSLGQTVLFGGRASGVGYVNTTWLVDISLNTAPVADAGVAQDVDEASSVGLDGGGSSDADGDTLSYAWVQIGGMSVTLTGAATATPSFTAPRVFQSETLTFQLTVDDGKALSSDTVAITVLDALDDPPVADAGVGYSLNEEASGALDGTASYDPDGSGLSYQWTQTDGPSVVLSGATTAAPTFTAPSVGVATTLTFSLVVSDGVSTSAPATVDVVVENVTNDPPVAEAGAPQQAAEQSTVTLDGSASSDPNDDTITYAWQQLAGGPTVTLSDASAVAPTFVSPTVTADVDVTFQLIVSDGSLESAADTVVISISNTINEPPVADAGQDDTVTEASPYTLNGSGTDPNGDNVTYLWSQTEGPAVSFNDATLPNAAFTAPSLEGAAVVLGFTLTVTDENLASDSAGVSITVNDESNSVPVAAATASSPVGEGDVVTLDGSASSDADGDPLTFDWLQTAGPAVVLDDATAELPTFTAPTVYFETDLSFRLLVNDGFVDSTAATVTVRVNNDVNEPPVANAGPDQSKGELVNVVLNGSASADPNGDALGFAWTQVSGPPVALSAADTASPSFTTPSVTVASVVELALVVSDGTLVSAADVVRVTVQNNRNEQPVADAGDDQTVAPAATVSLDGSGSFDPNGAALAYQWRQTGGSAVALDDDTAAQPSLVTPFTLVDEVLLFELVVSDGVDVSVADEVVVTVSASSGPPLIVSVPRAIGLVDEAWTYDDDSTPSAVGAPPLTWSLVEGPAGMTIDPLTGTASYLPAAPGTVAVRLRAENASGADEQSFVVAVYEAPKIVSTPNPHFGIGKRYQYGDGFSPTATGTPPIVWEIDTAAFSAVMNHTTGDIVWVPISTDPEAFTIRAHNAFGTAEQSFTVVRPADAPLIIEEASPIALSGVPYQYSLHGVVRFSNALEGEALFVSPGTPSPPELKLVNNRIHWVPAEPGTYSIRLYLYGANATFLDDYAFDVEVVANPGVVPEAVAVVTPTSGPAPLDVELDGSESSGALGQDILFYVWDMGDGSPKIGDETPGASYSYDLPGGYNVQLTVIDTFGKRGDDKVYVAVADGDNLPPRASIVADVVQGRDQLTVSLACDCDDPDGSISAVLWEYGDGDSSFEPDVTHTYVSPGAYRLRLTVWDDLGLVGTDSQIIEVTAGDLRPPQVTIHATPADGDSPMRVRFGADVYDEDGTVLDYRWVMPDGTTRVEPEFEEVFASGGYYLVELEVTDDDGQRGRDQLTVAVRADGVRPPRVVSEPARVALVDVPYRYDDDGLPTAQGGRPLVWRLGKRVDGVVVNAPAGMTVDLETGRLEWTPEISQAGAHKVTLIAENVAGTWVQDFTIDVVGDERPLVVEEGCACSNGSAPPDTSVLFGIGLGVFALRRGRRRRRRAGVLAPVLAAFALLSSTAASAAPVITSTPATAGSLAERWRYDDDGKPSASATGALSWSLGTAPDGMYVDNVSGELLWAPSEAGTFDVVLRAEDMSGVAEQSFSVVIVGGEPPTLLFNPPEGGFIVEAGKIERLGTETFAVPLDGSHPMATWVWSSGGSAAVGTPNLSSCMQVTTGNLYIAMYPLPYTCQVEVSAANSFGIDTQTFEIHFVEPVNDSGDALLDAALVADTTYGDAALTVQLDPSGSVLPPVEEGWSIQGLWIFGDGKMELFDGTPAPIQHVFITAGTYEAHLHLTASRSGNDAFSHFSLQSSESVQIVVTEDSLRPPEPALLVEPESGDAPLTVSFASETVLGDGKIISSVLEYGDGDRFAPVVVTPFEDHATSHVYGAPGWYLARLVQVAEVVDPDSPDVKLELRASVEKEIIVTDEGRIPPYARGSAIPARGDVPLQTTLTGEVGDLDGFVVSRHWILPDESISYDELPSLSLAMPGEYIATLVVRDDHGLESRAHVRVEATKDGVLPPRILSLPSRTAVAGQPWRYDDDGAPTAIGGGPYAWSVGKTVDGRRVNAPVGLSVDSATGELQWTPSNLQVGEVPVSLLVENVAGLALQDFVISVAPLPGTAAPGETPVSVAAPGQCACSSAEAEPPSLVALLCAALVCLRRRRGGDGGQPASRRSARRSSSPTFASARDGARIVGEKR